MPFSKTASSGVSTLDPAALHELSTTTAAPGAEIAQFSNSGGHAIGFNSDDGLVYFAESVFSTTFESFDPFGVPTVTSIGYNGGSFGGNSIHDLAYEGSNSFLTVSDDDSMYTISTAGVRADTGLDVSGLSGFTVTGLAYVGSTLYATSKNSDNLDIINRSTGVVTPGPTITLSGETVQFGIDLTSDPVTGDLYGLLHLSGGQTGRELVTINPTTGVATSIGDTGQGLADRFNGIVVVPEPSTYLLMLIGLGALVMVGYRRKRLAAA